MTTPVSFDLAKSLKEKGFYLKVRSMYCAEKLYKDTNSKGNYNDLKWVRTWRSSSNDDTISAPTIAEVVMWLYEKHGVWIEVSCHTVLDEKDDDVEVDVFYFVIRKLKPVNILYSGDFVNSPTEAYEAAIEYTLKNLIS